MIICSMKWGRKHWKDLSHQKIMARLTPTDLEYHTQPQTDGISLIPVVHNTNGIIFMASEEYGNIHTHIHTLVLVNDEESSWRLLLLVTRGARGLVGLFILQTSKDNFPLGRLGKNHLFRACSYCNVHSYIQGLRLGHCSIWKPPCGMTGQIYPLLASYH